MWLGFYSDSCKAQVALISVIYFLFLDCDIDALFVVCSFLQNHILSVSQLVQPNPLQALYYSGLHFNDHSNQYLIYLNHST